MNEKTEVHFFAWSTKRIMLSALQFFHSHLNETRAGVYETLYPQHMLIPKDNLITMLLYYTKCQSWKKEIIQLNIFRILPTVNQVIYTLDTICVSNITILAQAVLQIFCRQGPL